jgi:hypothetical protein
MTNRNVVWLQPDDFAHFVEGEVKDELARLGLCIGIDVVVNLDEEFQLVFIRLPNTKLQTIVRVWPGYREDIDGLIDDFFLKYLHNIDSEV